MINHEKLDRALLDLGFTDVLDGTGYLRLAVEFWDLHRGCYMTKDLYPAVARVCGATPVRVERGIRYAICTAFMRAGWADVESIFGNTIRADTGRPTASECIVRLAVFAREN